MGCATLSVYIVGTCYPIPDSLGTSFIFGFIRDADLDLSHQVLSVTVLNGGDQDCQFNLTYKDDYDKPLHTESFTASKGSTEISVPSWYGWQYESPGIQVQSGPNQLLTATSSCAVTVIANNFDSTTHQGDSFLVLPVSWAKAGSVFSFTLPPAANEQQNPGYQHITIIPTVRDVNGTLTVMGSNPLPFSAFVGDQPTTYFAKKTPQNDPHTYHIEADGPILLLAGVTCAGNYLACDHAAFMPHPLPTAGKSFTFQTCYERPYLDDDHPAARANGFYLDVPSSCSSTQNVTLTGNRGNLWKNIPVPVTQQSSLTVVDSSYGGAIYFHTETAPSHITRYYDQSQNAKQGAFIGAVPSLSQYIYGNSTFYTRNDNDIVEVICAIGFCISAKVDGVLLMSLDRNSTTITIPIHGTNYYTITATIPTKGFHTLTTSSTPDGPYSYFVYGQTPNATYGYMGAVNMPQVILLPTTTAAPSTATVTAPSVMPTTPQRTSSTSSPPITTTNIHSTTPVLTSRPILPSTTVTPTKTTTVLSSPITPIALTSTSAIPTTTAPSTAAPNPPSTAPALTSTPFGLTSTLTPSSTPIAPTSTSITPLITSPSVAPSTPSTTPAPTTAPVSVTSTLTLSSTPTAPTSVPNTPARTSTSMPTIPPTVSTSVRVTTALASSPAQFNTTLINRLSTSQSTLPRSLSTSSRAPTTTIPSKITTTTQPPTTSIPTMSPSPPPTPSTAPLTPSQPPTPSTAPLTPSPPPTPSTAPPTSSQPPTPSTAPLTPSPPPTPSTAPLTPSPPPTPSTAPPTSSQPPTPSTAPLTPSPPPTPSTAPLPLTTTTPKPVVTTTTAPPQPVTTIVTVPTPSTTTTTTTAPLPTTSATVLPPTSPSTSTVPPQSSTSTAPPVPQPSTSTAPPVPQPSTSTAPPVPQASTSTAPPAPQQSTSTAPPAPPVTTRSTQPAIATQSSSTTMESTTKSSSVPLYMTVLLVAYLTL